MHILFNDDCAPKAYTLETLETEAMGGTEATVIRVAKGLMGAGHDVNLVYKGEPAWNPQLSVYVDWVISLRDPRSLIAAKTQWPRAKHALWCHDWTVPQVAAQMRDLHKLGAHLIFVSQAHYRQFCQAMFQEQSFEPYQAHVIYNPIDNDLQPDATPIDPFKLVYFSSPHKGLTHALDYFQALRRFESSFKLYLANPGYLPDADTSRIENVVNLGPTRHRDIINHVRSALCVFYPNFVFPETFGLVLAEANAVGTPVLTSSLGAAREVLNPPEPQLVDVKNLRTVIDTVLDWNAGKRPKVTAREQFRLNQVVAHWESFLSEAK